MGAKTRPPIEVVAKARKHYYEMTPNTDMLEQKKSEYKIYDVRCKDLLEEPQVRFAAIIDEQGSKMSGGFKRGITPLEDDEQNLQEFMEYVAKISLRKDYNKSLGPINYIAFRRDKLILISFPFPLSPHILLVSAEPSVDIEKLASRVTRIFGDAKLFSEWDMKSKS